MMAEAVGKNLELKRRGKTQRTELGNRRGPVKTRRRKTVWTRGKRRTGERDGSDEENGSKWNYLRKQKRKRK